MALGKTRIRKNDTVEIVTGEDRGKRGRVLEVDRAHGYAVVEGANMVYKHQRLTRDPNRPNQGRIETEAPIHLSNLMLVDPKDDKRTRAGVRIEAKDDGARKRVRVSKRSGEEIAERTT